MSSNARVFDLLGVGFGPAGISLAAAIEDTREVDVAARDWQVHFLEARSSSSWQPGLLLRGTDINHHFLRDFATPRNPRSRFTFANYLVEKDRLFHFGHLGGPVGRVEWADYVEWTASALSEYVTYDTPVHELAVGPDAKNPEHIIVKTPKGDYRTRAIALSTGPIPNVPAVFARHVGARLFHSNEFLPRIANLDTNAEMTFCVVGSGQSAAEVLIYLHDTFPRARLLSLHRVIGFQLVDTGHFSNESYFPAEVKYVHSLTLAQRRRVARDLKHTNYSAIDLDASKTLYWKVYEDRVLGHERVLMLGRREPVAVESHNDSFHLRLQDVYTGKPTDISADVVILCTGYREEMVPRLLEPLRPWLRLDDEGGPIVTFDYQVETAPEFRPLLFLNGITERTHGCSDSASFSMTALKAGRILRRWRTEETQT